MKKNSLFLFLSIIFSFQFTGQNDFREKILKSVNDLRVKSCRCGDTNLPPVKKLTWNSKLETAAIGHASDMAKYNFFSHVSRNGDEIDKRVNAAGYSWSFVGENIAWGFKEIEPVMKGWRESYGHCVQLMSADVTEMGAAQKGTYWVMDFAKPLN